MPTTPKFKRVGPGVYDSEDGTFEMYRIEGVNPPAWNIDYSADYTYEHYEQFGADGESETVVDGAATKRDAMAIFAEWFSEREEAA